MGLTISLASTKWLVGSFSSLKRSVYLDPAAGVSLTYQAEALAQVDSFCYLGLTVDGSAGLRGMTSAILMSACKKWAWKMDLLTQWG